MSSRPHRKHRVASSVVEFHRLRLADRPKDYLGEYLDAQRQSEELDGAIMREEFKPWTSRMIALLRGTTRYSPYFGDVVKAAEHGLNMMRMNQGSVKEPEKLVKQIERLEQMVAKTVGE